jgi:hypothetical protein
MLRVLALLGAALFLVAASPSAVAPAAYPGPWGFGFDSVGCDFFAISPPPRILVHLTQATGIVSGQPVSSSDVFLLLDATPPAGYTVCQQLPNGDYRTSGDGTGLIVAL